MKIRQVNSINSTSSFNCANCWGHQEYNGQEIEKKETEKGKMPAFILKFVRKYLR